MQAKAFAGTRGGGGGGAGEDDIFKNVFVFLYILM